MQPQNKHRRSQQPTMLRVARRSHGMTLQQIIAEQRSVSLRKAKELIDTRNVLVNGQRIWMCRHEPNMGDTIELPPEERRSPSNARNIVIVFRDEHVFVINKFAGMLSNGPDSAETRLRSQLDSQTLRAAHRLDRDTTGCLLFAMNDSVFERIPPLFRLGRVRKIYHAIVEGHLAHDVTTIATPLDRQHALSHVRVIASNRHASYIEVKIETGRTHQIRKHLQSGGHPVLGDTHYGRNTFDETALPVLPARQMLHAASLEFEHPVTGQWIVTFAPAPPDFKTCLRQLRLASRPRQPKAE